LSFRVLHISVVEQSSCLQTITKETKVLHLRAEINKLLKGPRQSISWLHTTWISPLPCTLFLLPFAFKQNSTLAVCWEIAVGMKSPYIVHKLASDLQALHMLNPARTKHENRSFRVSFSQFLKSGSNQRSNRHNHKPNPLRLWGLSWFDKTVRDWELRCEHFMTR
jgi:hypothetical protein